MPLKSVREMSRRERLRHSLKARTFRSVVIGCLLLGFLNLAVGLGFYSWSLTGEYADKAMHISRSAASVIRGVADPVTLSREVMSRYAGLSEEELAGVGTDAYRARFRELEEREDYRRILEVLDTFRVQNGVFDVYLAMYDRRTGHLVYVADPDPDASRCLPGDWEEVPDREVRKFLEWDGQGRMYDFGRTEEYGYLCTSGVPVADGNGETVAFILTDITLTEIIHGMNRFAGWYFLAILLSMLGYGFLMTRLIGKRIVNPLNAIAGAASTYVSDRLKENGERGHFSSLDIHTGDEIENLSLVMADMEKDLSKYEDDLTKAVSDKEKIVTELNLARRIQASMLPHVFPAFPDRNEFDLFASMSPAKEVGGDFYDFYLLDDDHLCMVIADVSGKGIPAALFMMVTKILLKNHAMSGLSPAQVLEKANDQICRNNAEEMFVTVWMGVLEISTGRITACNAGHEYPVIMRPDGRYELVSDKHGFVIGGLKGMKYTEYEMKLEPGSRLFLYTDGVPEASNASDELFGNDRMMETLNSGVTATPRDVLERMSGAIEGFVGGAPRFDDTTMFCLSYYGPDSAESENGVEREFEAKLNNIPAVTRFVNDELEKAGCPLKAKMQLDVVVDELFCNIATYAYEPGTGSARVRVDTESEPGSAIITFTDKGIPFDPLQAEDPDVSLPADKRDVGGLGIFLVKKTMDGMSYEYRDGENIVTVKKNF